MFNWQKHIISDDKILSGKLIIKGTRISVEVISELISQGWTDEMILESYPNLTTEHIFAVREYLLK